MSEIKKDQKMSHYVDIVTEIKDQDALVRALERVGFKGKIEVHETAQNLYGYQGDLRDVKAHVIIRKRYVGGASNDIGFEKKAEKFVFHISEFDQGIGEYNGRTDAKYGKTWQTKLQTYYGVEKAKIEFEHKGWSYTEDLDEKERPRLRVKI